MSKRAILAATFVAALAAFLVVQGAGARTDAKPAPAAPSGCQLTRQRERSSTSSTSSSTTRTSRATTRTSPSDLEQMPHLLNFMKGNGTLLHERPHDADLAHRGRDPVVADGPLPRPARADRLEQQRDFNGTGFAFPSSFGTGPIRSTATNDRSEHGHADRAETRRRRGCRTRARAATSAASRRRTSMLENTGTGASGDMTKVFGTGSPQWNEAETALCEHATRRSRHSRRPTSSASRSTARRARRSCANGAEADCCPTSRAATPATRRSSAQGRRTGDHWPAARRVNDLAGQPITGSGRQLRLPRLRRHVRVEHARATSRRCRSRRPGHVRVHLRRARLPRPIAGNQHVGVRRPARPGYVSSS